MTDDERALLYAQPPKKGTPPVQGTSLVPETPPPVYNLPPGTEGIVPGLNKTTPTGMPTMPPIPQPGIAGYESMAGGFEPSIQPPPVPQQTTPLGGPDINAPYRRSNALAALASAIAPNSFGGRLGENVLGLNQQEIKNQEIASGIAQRGEAMRSMAEYRRSLAEERQARLRGQQQTEQMIQGLQTPSQAEQVRGQFGIAAPIPPQSPLEQYYPNPIERAAVIQELRKGTGLSSLLKPGAETMTIPTPYGPVKMSQEKVGEASLKGENVPASIREFEDAKKRGYIAPDMTYQDFKTMSPHEYGKQRQEMIRIQPIWVYDTKTHQVVNMTKGELDDYQKDPEQRGRYTPAELGAKYAQRDATFREIQSSAQILRNALGNLKTDFNATQRAQFAKVLKHPAADASTFDNFLVSSIGKTLTPDQVEYVNAIKNARESASALRSVAGMGPGSDMLRQAIMAALPGETTWSKEAAFSQLDKFDNEVDVLWSGIPENLSQRGKAAQVAVPKGGGTQTPAPTGGYKEGDIAYDAKGRKAKMVGGKWQIMKQ